MRELIRYARPWRGRLLLVLLGKVTSVLLELLLPCILSYILKTVILQQRLGLILQWGVLMLLCAGGACLCNALANRTACRVVTGSVRVLRQDLFHKMLHLSARQTDAFTIASLESRITTDIYNITRFGMIMLRGMLRAPVILVGGILITLFMDAHLALVMLAVVPFSFLILWFIASHSMPLFLKVQQSIDRMTRVVREDVQGIRVVKALSKEGWERERYSTVNQALVRNEEYAGLYMGLLNPLMSLTMNLGIVCVILLAAGRVTEGLSSPETILAFMQYFTMITGAMMGITRAFVLGVRCMASARRITEVMHCTDELPALPAADFPDRDDSALLRFEKVSFSYEGGRPDVQNISFALEKGQSLGIIGATAGGKTTLIRLLLRFYDTDTGCIRLNGQDIRTLTAQELSSHFGVVQQNDFLYADTIEENIRFGRKLSHEQVVRAAEMAQADSFITHFPDGYGHILSQKATNLSGGQKQRLLIARALAAEPEILILDDSSSALDYRTEAQLRHTLERDTPGSTRIIVAQRVSAVKNCDLILMMENGRILGRGTHRQLLDTCPEYREISISQMGGDVID